MNWEIGVDIHTLLCIKQTINESLQNSPLSSLPKEIGIFCFCFVQLSGGSSLQICNINSLPDILVAKCSSIFSHKGCLFALLIISCAEAFAVMWLREFNFALLPRAFAVIAKKSLTRPV